VFDSAFGPYPSGGLLSPDLEMATNSAKFSKTGNSAADTTSSHGFYIWDLQPARLQSPRLIEMSLSGDDFRESTVACARQDSLRQDDAANVLERLLTLIDRTKPEQWAQAAEKRKARLPVPDRAVSWVFLKELEDGLKWASMRQSTDESIDTHGSRGAVPPLPAGTRVRVRRLLGSAQMVTDLLLESFSRPAVRESLDRLCAELASKHELVYELLQRLDRNGDGRLSRDELRHGLSSLGVSLKQWELDEVIAAFDKNGDGSVDYVEFYTLLSKHHAAETASEYPAEPESEHNGKCAIVRSFDEHGNRYTVVLDTGKEDTGKELSLKPECVGLSYDDLNVYAHKSPWTPPQVSSFEVLGPRAQA
jgi:hypothetical protein